jgi:hypothetical protein
VKSIVERSGSFLLRTRTLSTRQGGVLSPKLFARYIRELLTDIVNSGVGCNVGGVILNVLAYADDIVLLAPSWRGLQCLLDLLTNHASRINMAINTSKSVRITAWYSFVLIRLKFLQNRSHSFTLVL